MKDFKLYILVLSMLSVFISCKENKSDKLISQLQGDWIYNNSEYGFISIKDSHFFEYEYSNDFEKFFINNDTLIVPKYNTRLNLGRVTDKYIWIKEKNNEKEIPLFLNTNIFHNSNLIILSLEIRFINFNNHGLQDWAIYLDKNMDCFMKIDSVVMNKRLRYPLLYSKGLYFSRLTPAEFEYYQNKFRNVPLNQIKKEYISNIYFPEPTCSLTSRDIILFECKYGFKDNEEIKNISFIVKGSECIPGYLGAFILHLNKICNTVKFNETFSSHNFNFYKSKYIF